MQEKCFPSQLKNYCCHLAISVKIARNTESAVNEVTFLDALQLNKPLNNVQRRHGVGNFYVISVVQLNNKMMNTVATMKMWHAVISDNIPFCAKHYKPAKKVKK